MGLFAEKLFSSRRDRDGRRWRRRRCERRRNRRLTWNLDDVYKRLDDAHVDVFPSIQGTIPAVSGTTDFPKPMPEGAEPTDPASYTDHGKMMFQFAARYGSTHVDASKLTLAAGQPVLSGAGYLRYLESGNEPDNIWAYNLGGSAMPQLADEFAAMSSADYDGDQGQLGAGVGAKTADATMKVVMAGLAGTAPGQDDWLTNVKAYLQGIKNWSTAHRGGSTWSTCSTARSIRETRRCASSASSMRRAITASSSGARRRPGRPCRTSRSPWATRARRAR